MSFCDKIFADVNGALELVLVNVAMNCGINVSMVKVLGFVFTKLLTDYVLFGWGAVSCGFLSEVFCRLTCSAESRGICR
jgi:hypothetical protein